MPEEEGVEVRESSYLDVAVQAIDDEYFKEHPEDDYYIRTALPDELAYAGYPGYRGLMLVYELREGMRVRKPVASVEDAVAFMVEFES